MSEEERSDLGGAAQRSTQFLFYERHQGIDGDQLRNFRDVAVVVVLGEVAVGPGGDLSATTIPVSGIGIFGGSGTATTTALISAGLAPGGSTGELVIADLNPS